MTKETDRIKVSNFIAGAVHSSGYRGTRFDAETAVTWKLNFRHPPKPQDANRELGRPPRPATPRPPPPPPSLETAKEVEGLG